MTNGHDTAPDRQPQGHPDDDQNPTAAQPVPDAAPDDEPYESMGDMIQRWRGPLGGG
ncbi:hypothetical protein [Actinoplanes sp. NBRC 101535]|uniref:hypothetical protein n=1 Tax=Actinoplanes sp. NBRC 101535 TaxID=3032196 RepID=UPI0024A1B34F|nr:hypothetical protein [Actinoplanes sp. NBRC 101535]GLY08291.1 hypothetical protein Acsp01_86700 [Actinoplanes sp. NBRC 101535]